MITKYTQIPIVPVKAIKEFSSWEDMIKDSNSPLYGYIEDFNKDGLKKLLTKILIDDEYKSKVEDGVVLKNFYLIYSLYESYISDLLPDDTEENKSKREELLQDLEKLKNVTSDAVDIFIKYGIIESFYLYIPYEKLTQEYAFILGEDVYVPTNNISLYAKNIENTMMRVDYRPSSRNTIYSSLNLKMEVYIFSKTKAKLIDITNQLNSVTISVTETGGNFQIQMFYSTKLESEDASIYSSEDISYNNSQKIMLFQSMFKENDLVFIKFESLKLEEDVLIEKLFGKQVAGKYWDMIGLIDITQVHSESSNISFNISGRDLIKIFIEDTNIFVPYQFANGTPCFGGYSSKLLQRLFVTGKYQLQFVRKLRSIEATMGFIISQLANIEILTDECYQWLVRQYGDKLGKQFEFSTDNGQIITKSTPLKGIFGLINFAVDEKITHYRLADSSISDPQGSIISQFYKVAQPPFVELIFDTFGDKYNIFARRPPFDRNGIKDSLKIPIDPVLSISEDLYFDTEVYTVFQYEPRGSFFGGDKNMYLDYLPFIVLDEYVKLWGNKLFKATSNYTNIDQFSQYLKDKGSVKRSPKYTYIQDLIWLLETMAYLPFTRKGKLVIRGDRRIKRGSWVWYIKTNELFYVDSVSNTAQISDNGKVTRTTILSVSRGMIKDYVESKSVSYFDLVNLKDLEEGLINHLIDVKKKSVEEEQSSKEEVKPSPTIVNKNVFDFFYQGKQFETDGNKRITNESDFIEIKK